MAALKPVPFTAMLKVAAPAMQRSGEIEGGKLHISK
jgi:hypothetical protein